MSVWIVEISTFTADTEAVSWPSSVARVASSSLSTLLLKCSGLGMSKIGWFKVKSVRLVVADSHGTNCREVAEDKGNETLM